MAVVTPSVVRLEHGYVRVEGPEASAFLERMLSNEVASLDPGG
jgi:glycine cleavage system aminomethyltransferase T